jgi:hypothetical protein
MPNTMVDAGAAVLLAAIRELEQPSTPRPASARTLLRLARQLELTEDRATNAVPWLASYLLACPEG